MQSSLLLVFPVFCFGHDLLSVKRADAFLQSVLEEEHSSSETATKSQLFYPNFSNNRALTAQMRQIMQPYLFPLDHPKKSILDRIFSRSRVIENDESLRKAGFTILFSQKKSFIRVVKHPRLKGYLIKLYPHTEKRIRKGNSGWKRLAIRCIVAKKIKTIIAQHKIKNFVVADKWIYPLPIPKTRKKHLQPVVLVVKDMNIYNREESAAAWRTKVSRSVVKELYAIFKRGYGSTYLHANLPYTKSGKFAFIDTEFDKRVIALNHARRYFSPNMRRYWDSLVSSKGMGKMATTF